MAEKTIDFRGCKLKVTGSMASDGEFEIENAYIGNVDVSDLIDAFDGWDEIAQKCADTLPDEDYDEDRHEMDEAA